VNIIGSNATRKSVNQSINQAPELSQVALVKLMADIKEFPQKPPATLEAISDPKEGQCSFFITLIITVPFPKSLLQVFINGSQSVKQLSLNLGFGDHDCHVDFFRCFEIGHARIEQLLRHSAGTARDGLDKFSQWKI